MLENRAVQALKRPANWLQLAKFGVVGGVGYLINLGVYVLLLGIGPHEAAAISFVVSAANNYWWNRHWTFADTKATSATRDAVLRGLVRGVLGQPALAARLPRLAGLGEDRGAGDRDRARDTAQLPREQALVVPALRAAALLALAASLALAPQALAGTTRPTTTAAAPLPAAPVAAAAKPRLTSPEAIKIFLGYHKVTAWLTRYPPSPQTDASFLNGAWTVNVFYGAAGEIATGTVDDATGAVTEAWTGPQVAWKMARGSPGAFGGTKINSYSVWLGFCAVFLLGLVDWRRPLSLRNLDLLMMLSFSVSLWFFNRGNVFAAMAAAYPGLFWLLGRCVWKGWRGRASRGSTVWPVWVLVAATVFLAGFRVGLNVRDSNVIDVGYSGVIGADRIAHGQSPYGHFPIEGNRPKCGPADSSGEVRDRIQTNGRCESADAQGDTYGPVAYEAYLPGYLIVGWSGKWDTLPAVHATSILWDLICVAGLALVGRRFGGPRLAATLAFAWAAWPFTQYASNSNTNDMIQPAILVWGFFFLTSPVLRGAFAALSALTKFAPLLVLPLWSGYPDARRGRSRLLFVIGSLIASALAFSVLLLEPSVWHAAGVFVHHTFGYQIDRSSPFSLWDWRQYHAKGLPDLHLVQRALQVLLVAGAIVLGRWPRRRSPLRLAAFTGALLVGFELVLTHWFYLYLPWFFPFVAFALLAPGAPRSPRRSPDEDPTRPPRTDGLGGFSLPERGRLRSS